MLHGMRKVRIILVRTGKPGNVGAVARAMANTEISDLWLVEPRCDPLCHESKRQSTRGEPILYAAHVVPTLADALDGITYTVGTSCRGGVYRGQIECSPRHMAAELGRRLTTGRGALVFGPEDTGLRDDEILACDAVVRIPSNPAYPSLNLAQAVMVCVYELYQVVCEARPTAPVAVDSAIPTPLDRRETANAADGLADAATLRSLMTKLESALLRIGYLRPEHPEHLLFPIRAILGRAGLSKTEAQILIGLAQQIGSFAARHAPPEDESKNDTVLEKE